MLYKSVDTAPELYLAGTDWHVLIRNIPILEEVSVYLLFLSRAEGRRCASTLTNQ